MFGNVRSCSGLGVVLDFVVEELLIFYLSGILNVVSPKSC